MMSTMHKVAGLGPLQSDAENRIVGRYRLKPACASTK